jgi:L-lactate dehydrogenase complex protein LldG
MHRSKTANQMHKAISSRDEILAKLRKGRQMRPTLPFPEPEWNSDVFPRPDNLLATFQLEFEAIFGKVYVGQSEPELINKLIELLTERNINSLYCLDSLLHDKLKPSINLTNKQDDFHSMEAAITRCECLVARTGSVVVSSAHESGRRLNVFPPIHIVWAYASQLVPFVDDAISLMRERYASNLPSQITVVTGASRTADIEKTLVMGAHGPKELIVLIDSSK